jgi:hypothetical protein
MTQQAQTQSANHGALDALFALVRNDGTQAHTYPCSEDMSRSRDVSRNAADAVHHLGLLHGRHPGVVDYAARRLSDDPLGALLTEAVDLFATERSLLTRLVVAVGPMPSTPGQADTESAVLAQHHAIDMLAQSDRQGCAAGAALALILDWAAIRPVLDAVAKRCSIDVMPSLLPDAGTISTALRASALTVPIERALMFGAHQIVAQHRGLWDLLEARQIARIGT